MNKLRDKALQVFSQHRSGASPIPTTLSVGHYGDDELALFGGQTRVFFSRLLLLNRNREKNRRESSRNSPFASSNSESPASDVSESPIEPLPDVHPSLVEYISGLPPSQHPPTELATEQIYNDPLTTAGFFHPPNSDMQNLYVAAPVASPQDSGGQGFSTLFPTMGAFTGESMGISTSELFSMDLMMTDSGIDQQWRSFMKESGLLDPSLCS